MAVHIVINAKNENFLGIIVIDGNDFSKFQHKNAFKNNSLLSIGQLSKPSLGVNILYGGILFIGINFFIPKQSFIFIKLMNKFK